MLRCARLRPRQDIRSGRERFEAPQLRGDRGGPKRRRAVVPARRRLKMDALTSRRRGAPRVVIAHEWLTNMAGSEAVVKQLCEVFPTATLIFGVADPALAEREFPGREYKSLLSPRLPGILQHWQRYAPVLIAAWRQQRVDCDLLIISSHFAAQQLAVKNEASLVVYYHSPMRFAWRMDLERGRFPRGLAPIVEKSLPILQRVDRRAGQVPGIKLANSKATAERVWAAYGVTARVVPPPVGREMITNALDKAPTRSHFLVFGRLVAYKRADIAVEACTRMNLPLIVAGAGPQERRLRNMAGPSVTFVGQVCDSAKWELLRGARALLFPGEEDFGIVPVEALAVGTPVIALGRGGVLDSVAHLDTGVLYSDDSVTGLENAITQFLGAGPFKVERLRAQAAQFSDVMFRTRFLDAVSGGSKL
jgi:glycosyltransferase involved in cell wall biosynthesis